MRYEITVEEKPYIPSSNEAARRYGILLIIAGILYWLSGREKKTK